MCVWGRRRSLNKSKRTVDDVCEVDGRLAAGILVYGVVCLLVVDNVGVDLPVWEVSVDPLRVLFADAGNDYALTNGVLSVGGVGEVRAKVANGGEGMILVGGPVPVRETSLEQQKDANGREDTGPESRRSNILKSLQRYAHGAAQRHRLLSPCGERGFEEERQGGGSGWGQLWGVNTDVWAALSASHRASEREVKSPIRGGAQRIRQGAGRNEIAARTIPELRQVEGWG